MKWKFKSRQRIGAFLTTGICAAVITSSTFMVPITHSPNAEANSKSASASFTISFTVNPKLRSQVTESNPEAATDESAPAVIATSTLTMDRPANLCVSGTGLSSFSLTGTSPEGVELVLTGQEQDTVLGEEPTEPLAVTQSCDNSHQLMAQAQEDFQGSTETAVVVIQAE